MTHTIGFVGTGIMGGHMAAKLSAAGHKVLAWNRSIDKVRQLESSGVLVAQVAADVASGADLVICMLSSGPVCDEVLLGSGGVLAAMRPGSTLIVMSSIPVETAQGHQAATKERNVQYLDAPVSGGEAGARAASLAIMVGGDEETFANWRDVLQIMGRPVRVGPAGSGQLTKLVNQMLVAASITAVAEGLLMAERGGAEPARVREALLGGFADSTVLRQHGQRMIDSNFVPGGPAKYQLKDTHTALALAGKLGLNLPMLELVDRLFDNMVVHGDGELDHSAIIVELRRAQRLSESGDHTE